MTSYLTTTINSNQIRTANKSHIKVLDSLRGIAALSVLVFHYVLPNGVLHKLYIKNMNILFQHGNLGVEIFFVISGFVIPYSLLGKGYTPRKFFSFMIKRIVRINPPAYVSMLLIIIQWYMIEHYVTMETPYLAKLSFMQVLHNLLFTASFSKYVWISGVFWTLAIEFQFYIIIGTLYNYLFERKLSFFIILFLFVGLAPLLYRPHNFFSFLEYSSLFAMGGLTLFKKKDMIKDYIYLLTMALFFGVCYAELGIYSALVGAFTALAIQYLSFSNVITNFLGKISYSLYLTHLFAGLVCQFILVKFISTGPFVNRFFMQLACITVAIASAYIFYLVVERPFIKLASRLKN